jgi:hypothetical protein
VSLRASSDSGNATVLVTIIGGLAMLVSFSLFDSIVAEKRSVEDNLADVRAYWAAIGEVNYALSRTLQGGGCAASCGNSSADTVAFPAAYLQEIACYRAWSYPEVSANYQFMLSPAVSHDPNAPSGQIGENLIRVTFAQTGTAPSGCSWPSVPAIEALRTIAHVRPVEFRYCVVFHAADLCGGKPQANLPGYHHITTILRPIS